MSQPLIDNLPLIAAAPDGIKALRGLILDLAVRGKLVPQDPQDQFTTKPVVGTMGREAPYTLPPSWEWVAIGDHLDLLNGMAFKPADWLSSGLKIVRIQNLNRPDAPYNYCDPASVRERSIIDDGALLISWSGTPGTSFGAFIWCGGPAVLNQHIFRCDLKKNVFDKNFLRLAVNGRLDEMIARAHGGVGLQHITKGKLEAMAIPLPPLDEQRRIVARFDELMALCDRLEAQQADAEAVHATLVKTLLDTLTQSQDADDFAANWHRLSQHFPTIFTTEASVDALKQTVLQLAVRGKLVRQDLDDEPMGALLKRMNVPTLTQAAFDIPDSWAWVPCGAVSQARLGKMLDKNKNRGAYRRYLRNLNVRWFDFDLTDLLEMKFEDGELPEFELKTGDVLICEGGEPGRAAVWDERDKDIYFQKALHRVRFSKCVDPHYFVKALRASADDGRLATYFTGSGIQHFTGRSLEKYAFPLPPLAEQRRIVAKVDELLALCDILKAQIAESRKVQRLLAVALIDQTLAA